MNAPLLTIPPSPRIPNPLRRRRPGGENTPSSPDSGAAHPQPIKPFPHSKSYSLTS
jgi:hypothetical protein